MASWRCTAVCQSAGHGFRDRVALSVDFRYVVRLADCGLSLLPLRGGGHVSVPRRLHKKSDGPILGSGGVRPCRLHSVTQHDGAFQHGVHHLSAVAALLQPFSRECPAARRHRRDDAEPVAPLSGVDQLFDDGAVRSASFDAALAGREILAEGNACRFHLLRSLRLSALDDSRLSGALFARNGRTAFDSGENAAGRADSPVCTAEPAGGAAGRAGVELA